MQFWCEVWPDFAIILECRVASSFHFQMICPMGKSPSTQRLQEKGNCEKQGIMMVPSSEGVAFWKQTNEWKLELYFWIVELLFVKK